MSSFRLFQSTLRATKHARAQMRLFSSSGASVASGAMWRRGAVLTLCGLTGVALYAQARRQPILLDASVSFEKPSNDQGATRTDPATGIEFPETLTVPSRVRLPPFQLVGVGVRTVSFLRMKVYSVGFYADLTNPNLKIPDDLSPEDKISYIVQNTACLLRIVPCRNTSFSHLRDGFMRSLQAHMSSQLKDGSLTPEQAELAQSPLRKFKSMFPSTNFAKGSNLDIILLAPAASGKEKGDRALVVRDLGSVEHSWVAEQFVLAYFRGDGLSPPMKQSVLEYLRSPATQ